MRPPGYGLSRRRTTKGDGGRSHGTHRPASEGVSKSAAATVCQRRSPLKTARPYPVACR